MHPDLVNNVAAAINGGRRTFMSIFQALARPRRIQINPSATSAAFVARIVALARLSPDETSLVQGLARRTRTYAARAGIWDATAPSKPAIMVSGWACRQRLLGDGRRQIINFLLPGDAVGDWALPGLHSDSCSVALTEVITADASDLLTAVARQSGGTEGLAGVLRQMAAKEVAQLQDHVVRLGRQTAYERMVHLMLEFHSRLRAGGLAVGGTFPMPLTQETLADALGLSVVHVNRTLMQLRLDGVFNIRAGVAEITDIKLMQTIADWVPTKLDVKTNPVLATEAT